MLDRIIIAGSGISGLALANIIRERGLNPTIYEASSRAGGLIACERSAGFLYHRVGGHVFNSKNIKVLNWFWSKFDRDSEFLRVSRNAKILLDGKYINYPIENSLYQLPGDIVGNVVDELIGFKSRSVNNFRDFLLDKFGPTLCSLYFFPYNEKIWKSPLCDISLEWLEGKLPTPDVRSVLVDNILQRQEKQMVHSTFFYPIHGGSQFIVDRLSEGLSIKLQTPVHLIESTGEGLFVNESPCDRLVYTGDVRKLASLVITSNDDLKSGLQALSDLKSHGTSNMLCECDSTDISWLYLPDPLIKAHRIIYTGAFAPSNNGNSDRISCVVEFSGYVSYDDMVNDVSKLPGRLRPIDWNYEEVSYIIHDKSTHSKVTYVIQALDKIGISLLGRFAEWQYYNMDAAIESAMRLANRFS